MLFFTDIAISCAVESIFVNWNIFLGIFKFYLILLSSPYCFLYTDYNSRCRNSIEFNKPLVSKICFFIRLFMIYWHLIIAYMSAKLLDIFLCDWHPILRVHKQRKITISNTAWYFITFINRKDFNIQKCSWS